MKKFSEIVPSVIERGRDSDLGSRVVALPVREKSLTVEDFGKLETAIAAAFHVKPVYKSVNVPVKDDLGNIIRWEADLQEVGQEVVDIGNASPRLLEAVQRPASPTHILSHLTRLAAHKRHTKGPSAFQVILEDISRDLQGMSEWAVLKACETFRKDESPFFPETGKIMTEVRKWNEVSKKLGVEKLKEFAVPEKAKKEPWKPPTEEEKLKVRQMLIDAGLKKFGGNE